MDLNNEQSILEPLASTLHAFSEEPNAPYSNTRTGFVMANIRILNGKQTNNLSKKQHRERERKRGRERQIEIERTNETERTKVGTNNCELNHAIDSTDSFASVDYLTFIDKFCIQKNIYNKDLHSIL